MKRTLLLGLALAALLLQSCSKSSADFNRDLIPVMQGGKAGFIDPKGSVVIAPKFEVASVFSNGLARVRENGKYGFIDEKGASVIPSEYKLSLIHI